MDQLLTRLALVSRLPAVSGYIPPQLPAREGPVERRCKLTFRFTRNDSALGSARVLVDGVDAGSVADYAGDRPLLVQPGRRHVQVMLDGTELLSQRSYLCACGRVPLFVMRTR